MSKILNNDPNELELQLAQALTDLENSSSDLKADLRLFQLKSAREIEVAAGKQAIVIFVPFPSLPSVHKVQQRLTRELEKKFADKHVIFIAERRILPKPHRRSQMGQKRPRSRTLTAVHAALLEDLVYPTQIVGKRVRYAAGGGKLERVLLDIKDRNSVDYKLDSFQAVYKRLTGKHVAFEFRDEIF